LQSNLNPQRWQRMQPLIFARSCVSPQAGHVVSGGTGRGGGSPFGVDGLSGMLPPVPAEAGRYDRFAGGGSM
jgi:hypothetical protein